MAEPEMPRAYVSSNGSSGCSFGCLGFLLFAILIMALVGLAAALFIRLFWWLLLSLVVLMLAGGVVRAIRRPRGRDRGPQGVIEGHVVEDEEDR